MAEQAMDQLIEQYATDGSESDAPGEESVLEDYLETHDEIFEWVIPPDQFVDFWVAAVFLLVGTWQIITMFFLLVG